MSDQKLNWSALTLSLGSMTDQPNRITAGSKKESDKDLVKWLTDLRVGKEGSDKVDHFANTKKISRFNNNH